MHDITGTPAGTATLTTTLQANGCLPSSLLHKLNLEWPMVYPRFRPVLDRWTAQDPVLERYRLEPDSTVVLPYEDADAYLLALLNHATETTRVEPATETTTKVAVTDDTATGDPSEAEWAARALLQLMLPGVRRLARYLRTEHDDEFEAEAQAAAAMHEAIVRYPAERQQRCAANLMFDALRMAHRSTAEGSLVRGAVVQLAPEPHDPQRSDRQPMVAWHTSASEELLWLLARAVSRGDLTRAQARLLADGTAYGWSRRLARELGISAAAVRQRRRYAVAKLRASVADLETTSDWLERRLDTGRRTTRAAKPSTTTSSHRGEDQATHACWPDAG